MISLSCGIVVYAHDNTLPTIETSVPYASKPEFKPLNRPLGVLISTDTTTYEENGYIITKTAEVYESLSRSNVQKTVRNSYSVKTAKNGEVLLITLDADFVRENGKISCPRYYSDYVVHEPDVVVSYEESDMTYTENNDARGAAIVNTEYKIVLVKSVSFGTTETRYPKMRVGYDLTGVSYT